MRLREKRRIASDGAEADGQWVDKRTVASRRDGGRAQSCDQPVVCSCIYTPCIHSMATNVTRHSMATNRNRVTCPRCGFRCTNQTSLHKHMKGADGCRCRRFSVVFHEMKAKHAIDMIDSEGRCLLSGWDHFGSIWMISTYGANTRNDVGPNVCVSKMPTLHTSLAFRFCTLQPHFSLKCKMTGM